MSEQNSQPMEQSPMQQNKVTKLSWTEQRCHKYANRFDTLEEWATGHQSSYKAAVAHGWVKSCTGHMSDTSLPDHLKSYKPSA